MPVLICWEIFSAPGSNWISSTLECLTKPWHTRAQINTELSTFARAQIFWCEVLAGFFCLFVSLLKAVFCKRLNWMIPKGDFSWFHFASLECRKSQVTCLIPGTGLQGRPPEGSFFQGETVYEVVITSLGKMGPFPPLCYFEECSFLESNISASKPQGRRKIKKYIYI